MTSVADLLAGHPVVALDANVLIYLLEGGALGELSGAILDGFATGGARGVLSALAITEIATGPARAGDIGMVDRYVEELTSLEGVTVVSLDAAVGRDAAVLRGTHGMGLSDAIHLASARLGGATAFVTNDRRVRPVTGLEVVLLDALEA